MNFYKLLFFSLIVIIACSCIDIDKQKTLKGDYQEFDSFFESSENFSGNALVTIKGKKIYSRSFGYANRELLIENTTDTKFRIGSISKTITAVAVMILVEKDLIDVEEHLSTYIPDIPVSWKDITIHQLLTHTSGLAYQPEGMDSKRDLTLEEICEIYKNYPLAYESGSAMNYSNMGYFILSIVIEKVSNLPFDSFVQKEIFEKLGMINSGGDYPKHILLDRAEGYELNADGNIENVDFENMLIKRGAGNMYSTVEDLNKLEKAFTPNLLLTKETLDKMMTPYTPDSDVGVGVKYGYGLDIVQNDSINIIFHTGGVMGFQSMFYVFPERGIVVTACANTTKFNRDWRTDFQKLVYNTISKTDDHKH